MDPQTNPINAQTKPAQMQVSNDEQATILESLYKQNIEVVTKNKTLSLLSKLYGISILTLEPKELAMRVCQTVQDELSLEFAEIAIVDEASNALMPLAFAKSKKMDAAEKKAGINLANISITNFISRSFYTDTISKKENITNQLHIIWGDFADHTKLNELASDASIKTMIILPLLVENKILGILILALNRDYDSLNPFEKESIQSFVNVIAVALEKSMLYAEVNEANIKLKELDHQKDAVLHMVAHQLRGPVATINFTTELLLDGTYGELTAEEKDNINIIRAASQKMGSQSEMVLDAAKITAGKLPLEPAPVDLNALFKEIVSEAETHARERKVKLNITLPTSPLPIAILDKKYTQLAIDNLLSNAVKYTALKAEGGNVYFSVEIKNGVLYCSVKDTGIGIPKAEQENIFKELYRASNAGKEGNGLGLHVAKGAIEAQGGALKYESQEGVGTTFYVELPLKTAS